MNHLKDFLQRAPESPGVYQMVDDKKKILYVGKAKNLKSRLQSYQHPTHPKVIRLMSKVRDIILTICPNEESALIVELSLIKTLKPPYNILLKDDKSLPFISLSSHSVGQIFIERDRYQKSAVLWRYGPYPSFNLAKQILDWVLASYQLRSCSDSVFKTRQRPCLEYQIGRCQAPCVFKDPASKEKYAQSVKEAQKFLSSPMESKISELKEKMLKLSENLDFEQAALQRDLIIKIHAMHRRRHMSSVEEDGRYDVIVWHMKKIHYLVIVRQEIESSEVLSLSNPLDLEGESILKAILEQKYYGLEQSWYPPRVISREVKKQKILLNGSYIEIRPPSDEKEENYWKIAHESLVANRKTAALKDASEYEEQFSRLEMVFLAHQWDSIECADVSHFQGDCPVGAVVRFDRYGPAKKLYRLYKIAKEKIRQNNDLESMSEMIVRHLKRRAAAQLMPNLLVLDGGVPQLKAVKEALDKSGFTSLPLLMAMTKDSSRKRGLEHYWIENNEGLYQEISLEGHAYEALLLQDLRDEAHRSAGLFRARCMKKALLSHPFDAFKGLKDEMKQQLLEHFGGWKGLVAASAEQIESVHRFSPKLLSKLCAFLKAQS